MAKRKNKHKFRQQSRTRREKSSDSSREHFASTLHRQLCLWDVLIHQLSVSLANRCRQVHGKLSTDTFRFDEHELQTVGWMLARGFDILIGHGWPVGVDQNLRESLWQRDEAAAEKLAEASATFCFEPLLRRYVEETRDIYPGRPHGDLTTLTRDLTQTLRTFLTGRCSPDGDLYQCLTHPLADHRGYFPDNGRPKDPAATCQDTLRDVSCLGLTVHAEDDGGDFKQKLVSFVRHDPWLFTELVNFIQRDKYADDRRQSLEDSARTLDQATDDFIFHATRLDGKTPIQLLLERQNEIDDRQRQRLERWDKESFASTFLIQKVLPPFVEAVDLATNITLRITGTLPEAIRSFQADDLVISRITPWDDYWLFSGIQQRYDRLGKDADAMDKLRQNRSRDPVSRRLGPEDPTVREGFKIQQQYYEAWLALYGQEELMFEDGLQLGAAMNRFYRYWGEEMILPDTGLTRKQSYQQQYGQPPPEVKFPLPESLLEAKDVAAVFNPRHGLLFFVGYKRFRSAFEFEEPLTDEQIQCVWDYLLGESVDYWLFQRMRERYPQRTEQVLQEVLNDQYFQLERDFNRLLRKFKGEAMRKPLRPMMKVIDLEAEKQPTRRKFKQ